MSQNLEYFSTIIFSCKLSSTLFSVVRKHTSLEIWESNFNSTKGVGATAPDVKEAQMLEDGVVVPLGRPKEQGRSKVVHFMLFSEISFANKFHPAIPYLVKKSCMRSSYTSKCTFQKSK